LISAFILFVSKRKGSNGRGSGNESSPFGVTDEVGLEGGSLIERSPQDE